MQNTAFSVNKTLNVNGTVVDLTNPLVMGILNVTPDSFYDGGRYNSEHEILAKATRMVSEGASIIDVGGYSTRPGAAEISTAEERARILPVIKILRKEFPKIILSIDSFRSEIVRAAVNEGANLANDVSGGTLDDNMYKTIGDLQVPYVLMHLRGTPQTMAKLTTYNDLISEVIDYLQKRILQLTEAGVKDIIIDPGFGFAKSREGNFELLNNLHLLRVLGKPILAGLSRKSMIWKTLEISADDALNGTSVLNTIALDRGASILRVHDVKEAVQAVRLVQNLKAS